MSEEWFLTKFKQQQVQGMVSALDLWMDFAWQIKPAQCQIPTIADVVVKVAPVQHWQHVEG